MKVVFLQDDFPPQSYGGAGISTYELAFGMKAAGLDVSVITTCQSEEDEGESSYNGLRVFKVFSKYSLRWRWYVCVNNYSVVRKVEKILNKIQPDVVHANNIHTHLSYASLRVSKKYAHVIFTARDVMAFSFAKLDTSRYLTNFDARTYWFDHFRQAGKRWNLFRNYFIRRYLNYADKKFAISYALKNALEQNGINKVGVIYNGIDVNEWHVDLKKIDVFKNRYNLQDKKIIFFNGRLSRAKGAPQVLEAFDIITKEYPNVALLVAGTGMVDSINRVTFTGWLGREEIKLAYAASDIVLMPSVCLDAFGRVNLEAMASKKPVIGTCYGGTPEVVEDGVTGYIVNPLHPEQIAKKTVDLLKDSMKAQKFGQAGYERAKSLFGLNDRVKEYISVYKLLETYEKN